MKAMISVETPKGKAMPLMNVLKFAVLGTNKIESTEVNKEQSKITYIVSGDLRKLCKIRDNCNSKAFKTTINILKNNNAVVKGIRKLADTEEDFKQVMILLNKNTKIDFKFIP